MGGEGMKNDGVRGMNSSAIHIVRTFVNATQCTPNQHKNEKSTKDKIQRASE
jgi:hypothetical protein